jgi:hypothetical protein
MLSAKKQERNLGCAVTKNEFSISWLVTERQKIFIVYGTVLLSVLCASWILVHDNGTVRF